MDIGIIIAMLLQIGLGILLVYAGRKRKKRLQEGRNPKFWRIATRLASVWGWILVVSSTLYLLAYLVLYLLTLIV